MTLSLPVTLLVVAGLLAVVSVVQRLATRLTLPASILFAVLGTAVGTAATVVLRSGFTGPIGDFANAIVAVPVTSETFLYVLLPALLFQSALTVDVKHIAEDFAPIFLLAVVAVFVATAVIGMALAPFSSVPIVACLLVASIVATTDTVAVISIFRDVGAPSRLCHLVEGESLLNDAAAIVAFGVLLGMLTPGHAEEGVGAAAFEFVRTFAGGLAVGYIGARAVVAMLPWLEDLRLAQVTLTLALPYLVFIIGDKALGVSGVIAAVTAGLVMGTIAQPRIAPSDWKFLLEMWEQLAYWASSLIFVLAALLVPRLLGDVSWHDAIGLTVMIVAALAARAAVLFWLVPLLERFGLSQRIDPKYNLVILWGGLRGAVTLALALAVTENDVIDPDIRRFVAVHATGFVLFTLLVQGLTLRPLIKRLGLDRLSAFDEALRAQVLALSRGRVASAVRRIGKLYQFGDDLVADVATTYQVSTTATTTMPIAATHQTSAFAIATDEEQTRLGLVALAQREREIVLEHFDARVISSGTVEGLLGDIGFVLDGVRTRGQTGYVDAGRHIVGFSRSFRVAHLLHRRFRVDRPLVDRLADRFERLLVSRIVLGELAPYVDETLALLVNDRVTPRLRQAVAERQAMTAAAIEAMRAQYSAYAALLEQRFLRRVALRREDLEYHALFDENVIGPELYGVLSRELAADRVSVRERPRLDLGLDTRALIARVSMFAELDTTHLSALARLLRPRFAVPDERLIAVGDAGDAMYFISSGVVEVRAGDKRILLTGGDFFGEMALVLNQPRQANVFARSYCQLLILARRDFQALLRADRSIRERIDVATRERLKMNTAPGPAESSATPSQATESNVTADISSAETE